MVCGKDEEHAGAAFQTWGLGRFEQLMEAQPPTSHAIVVPAEEWLVGVDAHILTDAYAEDPAQADRSFRFATFEVWGPVASVAAGDHETTVRLDGGDDRGDVVCSYRTSDTPEVEVGERVAVLGIVLGLADSGDVLLDRCEFVRTEEDSW